MSINIYNNVTQFDTGCIWGGIFRESWGYVGSLGPGGWCRFSNILFSPGDTIEQAVIRLYCYGNTGSGGTVNLRLYCANAGNQENPTTISEFSAIPLTTSYVNWNAVPDIPQNSYWDPIDITTLVQEVVSREDWVSGNSIMVMIMENGSDSGKWRFFDWKPNSDNLLTITARLTRFWINNGGSWNDTSHWSYTSGGAGGSSVPTSLDPVIFDENSFSVDGENVLITSAYSYCGGINCENVTKTFTIVSGGALYHLNFCIAGDFILNDKVTFSGPSIDFTIYVGLSETQDYAGPLTFSQNGATFGNGTTFSFACSGGVNLGSDFIYPNVGGLTGQLWIEMGTFRTNNYNVVIPNYFCAYNIWDMVPIEIYLGTSTLETQNFDVSNCETVNLHAEDSTIILREDPYLNQGWAYITIHEYSFGDIIVYGNENTEFEVHNYGEPVYGKPFRDTYPTINNITIRNVEGESGQTYNFYVDSYGDEFDQNLYLTGDLIIDVGDNRVDFEVTYLYKESGTITLNNCDVSWSSVSGGATFNALLTDGNIDSGNNLGWNFEPSISEVYTDCGELKVNTVTINEPEVKFYGTLNLNQFYCDGEVGENNVLEGINDQDWNITSDERRIQVRRTTLSHSHASGEAEFLSLRSRGNVDDGNNTGWIFEQSFIPKISLLN